MAWLLLGFSRSGPPRPRVVGVLRPAGQMRTVFPLSETL